MHRCIENVNARARTTKDLIDLILIAMQIFCGSAQQCIDAQRKQRIPTKEGQKEKEKTHKRDFKNPQKKGLKKTKKKKKKTTKNPPKGGEKKRKK